MPIPKLSKRVHRVYGDVKDKTVRQAGRLRRFRIRLPKLSWPLVKKLVVAGGILGAAGLIGMTILVAWVSRDLPDPNKLRERQVAQSTKIFDRTGQHLLYEVYQKEKRTVVELDQISPWMAKATVAVEDKAFYEHKGVRIRSILRAGVSNVLNRALGVVGIKRQTGSGGASTLTQQAIKNTIVGDERTLTRKIKEAILAIQMERKYSKDDIMKLYLNEILYGLTNYGVEAAAQSYFHKSAKNLTLPEAATLASIPKRPNRYLSDLEALKQRRNLVLFLMWEQGYITEAEKKEAQASELKIARDGGLKDAPHFVLYVRKQLADQFGEQMLGTGGLKVITTIDFDKQKEAEKIVKENGKKFAKEANANNAGLVAADPKTGQILAHVGSRDYFDDAINGQFDVATLGRMQPGSSFKPFVYTLAFQKGFTPDTVLYDVSTQFDVRGGKGYRPRNGYNKEYGLVTMRKALQGSLNISAVKTLYLAGVDEMVEFSKKFGYTTFTGKAGLSMVLGSEEVNLLEHTFGYATLANNGRHLMPVSILKVENPAGEILYEWMPMEGEEAIKPELAALMASVLSDNAARTYIFGASSNLILPDRPVAAKTGTTQQSEDVWTLGYTPSLVTGVWVGNTPTRQPMAQGSNKLAGTIWNQFMRFATKGTPVEQFPAPPASVATKPVLRGSDIGIKLMINQLTGNIATSSTPPELIGERVYLPPHVILHYVRKDDPQGEPPENPADDPQYEHWEQGLQEWIARQQAKGVSFTLEEPPTVYDAPQSAELLPTLEILMPGPGAVLTSRQLDFSVKAAAPRGVFSVSYFIDGSQIGAANQFPFNYSYYAQKLAIGEHALRVMARDDLGNTVVQEVIFTLQAEFDPPSFEWFDKPLLSIAGEDFPRTFHLTPFRWDAAQELKVFVKLPAEEKLLHTFNAASDQLFNNQLFFTWKENPGAGSYTLRSVLTNKQGGTVEKNLEVLIRN